MKFWLIVLMASSAAQAEDLLCTGTIYADGQPIPITRVFSLDADGQRASVQTKEGMASGAIEADPEIYKGRLYAAGGAVFWFNLNRYTGSLVFVPMPAENQYGTTDFNGECKRAERRF